VDWSPPQVTIYVASEVPVSRSLINNGIMQMGNLSPGTAEAHERASPCGHFKYQMKVQTRAMHGNLFSYTLSDRGKAAARIYNEKINDASRRVHMRVHACMSTQ